MKQALGGKFQIVLFLQTWNTLTDSHTRTHRIEQFSFTETIYTLMQYAYIAVYLIFLYITILLLFICMHIESEPSVAFSFVAGYQSQST